jgi:hypothetical protein
MSEEAKRELTTVKHILNNNEYPHDYHKTIQKCRKTIIKPKEEVKNQKWIAFIYI